jgi:hypothetical protein
MLIALHSFDLAQYYVALRAVKVLIAHPICL